MIRRKIKNVVKNFSEVEIVVREATSNESWGPSNSTLVKIAILSSVDANLIKIMPIIWKRLKDTGKKWRHVYKSLILLEFLITRGNPSISENCKQNIHFLQTLEEFTYEDNNVDVGSRIRKRAESLVRLLKDNDLLRNERNKAAITEMRLSKAIVSQGSNVPIKYGNGIGSLNQGPSTGSFKENKETDNDPIKTDYIVPENTVEEDIHLQIALAESQEAENQRKKMEEIDNLTDQYKLSYAFEKNFVENKLSTKFDQHSPSSSSKLGDDGWGAESTKNDPWSPVPDDTTTVVAAERHHLGSRLGLVFGANEDRSTKRCEQNSVPLPSPKQPTIKSPGSVSGGIPETAIFNNPWAYDIININRYGGNVSEGTKKLTATGAAEQSIASEQLTVANEIWNPITKCNPWSMDIGDKNRFFDPQWDKELPQQPSLYPNINNDANDYDTVVNRMKSASISQTAITEDSMDYNPWSIDQQIRSNPTPRKLLVTGSSTGGGNANKSDSVADFLANHSHLVDFDNIITVDCRQKPTATNHYNPFHDPPDNSSSTPSYNPFLLLTSRNVSSYPSQIDWGSVEETSCCTDKSDKNDIRTAFLPSPIEQKPVVKQRNLNPFQT